MKSILVVLAFLLAGFHVSAGTNAPLTWEACLARTEADSPELAAARAAIRELEYNVGSASSGFFPQIDASSRYNRGQNESDRWVQGEGTNIVKIIEWQQTQSASASIDIRQNLFSGFGTQAKRKQALARLLIGREQYRATMADVELQLRLAFINTLYAQELIELTRQIEERRASNVRLIQLRYDGGRENAGSLARSKAQLTQASVEVRQAERSLAYSLRNLAAAMGSMEPEESAEGVLKAPPPGMLSNLYGLMRQTPDYEIALTQVAASKEGVRVARSDRFPQISLSTSTGMSGDNQLQFEDWSVGIAASIPLFSGNQISSEIKAAKEQVVQNEMDLINTGNMLMATLHLRWNSYQDAVENEATQQELLDAEILRAKISTAKYKQGLLSFEDWDTIESNLITQGKTHLQRRRTSEIERAQWKNALGRSEWQTAEEGETL